jgi:DNA-binding transcriptional regulator YbjK
MQTLETTQLQVNNLTLLAIQRTLQQTRASLAIADTRISVSIMRHFFERIGDVEIESLRHIISYYLSKPAKDDNDRDKIDLLVTRFCSFPLPSTNNLKLRQVVDNLEEVLEELCHNGVTAELESVQMATIAKLRQLGRALLEARSFNNLIESKLVSQLRQYKINLGDALYTPVVLAEVIKVNIAAHNKFQELYYAEQARLRMETARMLRSLQDSNKQTLLKNSEYPMVGQLSALTIQMQQLLQELKRSLTEQILQDRVARASIEAEGGSITMLIGSLEESLQRSRELLKKLQELYLRTDNR